jgi:hypothetical protein
MVDPSRSPTMTRQTFPSLLRFYLTAVLTFGAILALGGCGGGAPSDHQVKVRRYEDVNGTPTPNADSLGLTYYLDDKGSAKHGAAGYNCLINEVLVSDADADKIVRVIMHELTNVLILSDDSNPAFGPGWYSWDSDTLPPLAPVPLAEGAWIAEHEEFFLSVGNDWLADSTVEAADRLNAAAGKLVFVLWNRP